MNPLSIRNHVIKVSAFVLVVGCVLPLAEALATTFTPGGLLVQSQIAGRTVHNIREYSLTGTPTRTVPVPRPPGQTDVMSSRDLAIDAKGILHLYNGTFDPYLSFYNPRTDQWAHVTTAGWSTVNNVSYGGIAVFEDTVFLTDMETAGPMDSLSGIVAIDTVSGTVTRFATSTAPEDLNLGLDGRLYSLSGSAVSIYDPKTFGLLDTVNLAFGSDYRSVSADAAGNMYLATWGGALIKSDPTGSLLDTIALPGSGMDVDISPTGLIAVGTRLDGVFITDSDFSFSSGFDNGEWNSFVHFAPVPIPAAAWLFGGALVTLFARRRVARWMGKS